ncbi:uncharacterized protein [Amphiura filiformis]|uniref:uncharacterized protein n=1 Tax=Amphiura filiformis TaxID=82378 RepID=UPI003B212B08
MRSCSMLRRILPVAFIFALPILAIAENRHLDNDIPSLIVTEEDQDNSSDFGLQSANILLDVIERILDRLESSAVPPSQPDNNDILQSVPETSWPPLDKDFLPRDLIYLPKSSSSSNALALGIASYGRSRQRGFAPCTKGLCRVIRGRKSGNANAGARALPFGKRNSDGPDTATSSVRGRRRGRGRPRSRGSLPQQNTLPFGKRRV